MIGVAMTIAPIFLMIGLGTLLKAKAGFSENFWQQIEKLTFNGLFPSLLFVKIADVEVAWGEALPIAAAIVFGIHITAIASLPFRRLLKLDPRRFVSVFQGGFRSNAYVGIAIVLGTMDDTATGAMAVCIFTVAITINFLGVWAHLKWIDMPGRRRGWAGVTKDSLRNPLIVSCLIGAGFNVLGLSLPPLIGPTLDLLGRAALPMGLMAVGAGLSINAVRGAKAPVTVACINKVLVQPAATYGLGLAFGLSGAALVAPVVFAALPTSSTSYVVSRQMGSDAPVMAAIVTATHVAAIVTLPVWLTLIW